MMTDFSFKSYSVFQVFSRIFLNPYRIDCHLQFKTVYETVCIVYAVLCTRDQVMLTGAEMR